MTDEQLDSLESAAKAATPGPWTAKEGPDFSEIFANDKNIALVGSQHVDAAYIAAANPAAILEMIAELRQARAERDDLEELLNDYIGGKAELDALKLKDAEAEREWLAKYIVGHGGCPSRDIWEKCTAGEGETDKCIDCWLEAAKEATCQKN